MKVILIFALAIAAANAASLPPGVVASLLGGGGGGGGESSYSPSYNKEVSVTNYLNEIYPNGNYKFYYELSDGSARSEEGLVKNEGLENQYMDVNGYYAWNGPDKVLRKVVYSSGVEGFKSEITEP